MLKSEPSADKKIGTILFVDDEPLSLKYFKSTVSKYANVKTASSTAAAIEILESEGEDISVVVSDERMPRESGVSFLSHVRKSWPSTVRILTSAYANIENLQHAINQAGIHRFVPKPWDLDELCAAMQDALHVERAADEIAEPILGPALGGDAQDANLALLAILANSIETPLKSLTAQAQQLTRLSSPSLSDPPHAEEADHGPLSTWTTRFRQSKAAASAGQIQQDVEQCRALMKSIGNIARGLAHPAAVRTSSMADTIHEFVEQNGGTLATELDVSGDFTYRMPREIMKFVLGHVLRPPQSSRAPRRLAVELFAGRAHNEIRIRFGTDHPGPAIDDNQTWRTVRSALWAFGGEVLASTDQDLGKSTLIVCLPKAA